MRFRLRLEELGERTMPDAGNGFTVDPPPDGYCEEAAPGPAGPGGVEPGPVNGSVLQIDAGPLANLPTGKTYVFVGKFKLHDGRTVSQSFTLVTSGQTGKELALWMENILASNFVTTPGGATSKFMVNAFKETTPLGVKYTKFLSASFEVQDGSGVTNPQQYLPTVTLIDPTPPPPDPPGP
jgi:hypothetical protein